MANNKTIWNKKDNWTLETSVKIAILLFALLLISERKTWLAAIFGLFYLTIALVAIILYGKKRKPMNYWQYYREIGAKLNARISNFIYLAGDKNA